MTESLPQAFNPTDGAVRVGLPKTGPLTSIIAAATSATLYRVTTGRTYKVRKVHVMNRTAAQIRLDLGDGNFNQRIPGLVVPAGQHEIFTPDQLGDWEFTADLVGQSTAGAAAPADVQVQATVEELGP